MVKPLRTLLDLLLRAVWVCCYAAMVAVFRVLKSVEGKR